MAWFKRKPGVVYEIKGRERGLLEAFMAQKNIMDNTITSLLKGIVEREQIAPESLFDVATLSFVKPKKQDQQEQKQ